MEKPTGHFLIFSAIFLTTMLMFIWDANATTESHSHSLDTYSFFPQAAAAASKSTASYSSCSSMEECLMNNVEEEPEEDEMGLMDSESNRRTVLARRRYISYGALSRDRVPCSRRGYSYYNCRPGQPVNPYNRGCSAITRCRHF